MKRAKFEGYPSHLTLQSYEGSEITGVKAFQIHDNYIIVQFKDGRSYLYNEHFPGMEHVKMMKEKALNGDRLGTYINQNVRDNYFAFGDKADKKFKLNKNSN